MPCHQGSVKGILQGSAWKFQAGDDSIWAKKCLQNCGKNISQRHQWNFVFNVKIKKNYCYSIFHSCCLHNHFTPMRLLAREQNPDSDLCIHSGLSELVSRLSLLQQDCLPLFCLTKLRQLHLIGTSQFISRALTARVSGRYNFKISKLLERKEEAERTN